MRTEFIYGIHTVTALLQRTPERIISLYLSRDRHDAVIEALATTAKKQAITVQYMPRDTLEKHARSAQHQGVVAECHPKKLYDEAALMKMLQDLKVPPFLLVLDDIQDPHNLGACLRTADAAGVHAVIAPKDKSVGITPAVQKVASGAVETVPFVQVTNLARTLRALRDAGVWLYGLAGEAEQSVYQGDYRGAVAFVMGAEGEGLRRLTREHCDVLLRIPMVGHVESLNVSVATAVCLYEAVRQRNLKINNANS